MDQSLPFFPESFPDETLWSRVSRYHMLSGNHTDAKTFKELFGVTGFAIEQVVPPAIGELAARLPGNPAESLKRLLQDNTILPAFAPFLGQEADPAGQVIETDQSYRGLSRMPRRGVAKTYSENSLCLSCLREDIRDHGIGYWHRSHQIPGVRVCWKHRERLLRHCPTCRRPISRGQRLLILPWQPCPCTWAPAAHTATVAASELERQYAEFAHQLLAAKMFPIMPRHLRDGYRRKILDHGFVLGNNIAVGAFYKSLETEFGADFLAQTDSAYFTQKNRNWIRLTLIDGQLEMPITRHILLSMYLFGDFNSFASHMRAQKDEPPLVQKSRVSDEKQDTETAKLSLMRGKVRQLKAQLPALSLEDLWKKSYATAEWLYDNDRDWLLNALNLAPGKAPISNDEHKIQDAKFAKAIDDGIDALYLAPGKPARITKERIRKLMPKPIQPTAKARELYPLCFVRFDRYLESYWHFAVRRLLFGLSEVKRLQATPVNSSLRALAGIHHHAFEAIIAHCNWNIDQMVWPSFDVKAELVRAGIDRQWAGPVGHAAQHGGRRYKAKSRE